MLRAAYQERARIREEHRNNREDLSPLAVVELHACLVSAHKVELNFDKLIEKDKIERSLKLYQDLIADI